MVFTSVKFCCLWQIIGLMIMWHTCSVRVCVCVCVCVCVFVCVYWLLSDDGIPLETCKSCAVFSEKEKK